MFSEPLFNLTYINKEINAVNSEHEKNINQDGWRLIEIIKTLANKNHPFSKFSTGNSQTFLFDDLEYLRDKLKSFYEEFYITDSMRLIVISNLDLETL